MLNFSRVDLHELEQQFLDAAKDVVNPSWVRALHDAAHAVNVVDAFVARSGIGTDVPAPDTSAPVQPAQNGVNGQ